MCVCELGVFLAVIGGFRAATLVGVKYEISDSDTVLLRAPAGGPGEKGRRRCLARGSGSANQNHSTSLARAISYLVAAAVAAAVERLFLLMPSRLAGSSILRFTTLLTPPPPPSPHSSFLTHFISHPPYHLILPTPFQPHHQFSFLYCLPASFFLFSLSSLSFFFSFLSSYWLRIGEVVPAWLLWPCALNCDDGSKGRQAAEEMEGKK